MSLNSVPRDAWKALATVGIWVGIGMCALAGCQEMKEIAGSGTLATVLMWIFA